MPWLDQVQGRPLDWLFESESPGARYLALRDLAESSPGSRELQAARRAAHEQGPIPQILGAMDPAGFWMRAGPGYNPKYRSTVWSLIMLAQLGASVDEDRRIEKACAYLLDHALTPAGQFTATGAPSGTIDCLQGNLCWALLEMGCRDSRMDLAFEWMARSVTGEGVAPAGDKQAPLRYYAYKCGPGFACGVNEKLACAWGADKVMLAFGRLPAGRRTPLIKRAIKRGVDFLLSTDPSLADYPSGAASQALKTMKASEEKESAQAPKSGKKPNRSWWKFGFPVFYVTDILQTAEALVGLGYGHDARLANTLSLILGKQDKQGRWSLEYDYAGKTWCDFGPLKAANKFVTLRALRVLKAAG